MSRTFYEKVKFITEYHTGAEARGWFKGSAYQFHPHGYCRDGVLIYDHHNTNDYYTIAISENPNAFWTTPDVAPASWGANPLPTPIGCELIQVWYSGEWRKDGPWVGKIEALVDEIEAEIEKAIKRSAEIDKRKNEADRVDMAAKESNLRDAWK